MPRINLLPWRTELRQQRKKEFLVALGAPWSWVPASSTCPSSRCRAGQRAAKRATRSCAARSPSSTSRSPRSRACESQRERLLARMQVITQLQRSRPEVVHLFDELVNAIPEGVNLLEVMQQGGRIQLRGSAQSSTRVSALMRNIDGSDWLPTRASTWSRPSPRASIATRSSGCSRNRFPRLRPRARPPKEQRNEHRR